MQRADVILTILSQKSQKDRKFVFTRFYRHLFNPDFYVRAFHRICAGDRNRELKKDIINTVIELLKTESYYPRKLETGKRMPAAVTDQLVQEVLRQLLEAVYEPIFMDSSHGFRPGRDHQTALYQIKRTCTGVNWLIEGRFKNFPYVDYKILFQLIRAKICDERLIKLIERFLEAGYMENIPKYRFSWDNPLQGVISPLLLNIYLHELDKFMLGICNREIKYTRCAGEFLVCIKGSKQTAEGVRSRIREFLSINLCLDPVKQELSLANLSDRKVRFLDYDIVKSNRRGVFSGELELLVPREVTREKLVSFRKNNKAIPHRSRINLDTVRMIKVYNKEINRLYNYYALAADVSNKLGEFKFYHYHSLVKTIATKEKISVKQVIDKYGVEVQKKQGTGTRKIISATVEQENKVITYFNKCLERKDKPLIWEEV